MSTALQGPLGTDDGPLRPFAASQTQAAVSGGYTMSPPCRAIRVGVAGTVAITYATGQTDTISLNAGETLHASLIAITAGTATNVTVFW